MGLWIASALPRNDAVVKLWVILDYGLPRLLRSLAMTKSRDSTL